MLTEATIDVESVGFGTWRWISFVDSPWPATAKKRENKRVLE